MDVLGMLNSYAQGYRDDEINDETVFAAVAGEVIEELRAIRQLLEGRGGFAEASAALRDTRSGLLDDLESEL